MAYPYLLLTGKFGYKVKRKFHLTPSKNFSQKLLHYSQQFASGTDYIFFTHAVMQKIQLNDQINIAMKKIASDSLNAGKLSKNFKAAIQRNLLHRIRRTVSCLPSKTHQLIGQIFYLKCWQW